MVTIPEQQPYIQALSPEWYDNKVVEVAMLRLDIIHKEISGNKWYKLKENIKDCLAQGKKTILTFGGGYSNHLAATAAIADIYGLQSVGIVRGRYDVLTPTLETCSRHGMKLVFVTTDEYKQKMNPEWWQQLSAEYDAFVIPEGGANAAGRKGAEDIGTLIPPVYTYIATSVGTGTTLVGIVNSTYAKVFGFAPMKGGAYVEAQIKEYINIDRRDEYKVLDDWHFGGFGKQTPELISFMNDFYSTHNIPLDIVYTGKMMYGIKEMISAGVFPAGARILCIHTGGLQGNAGVAGNLLFS